MRLWLYVSINFLVVSVRITYNIYSAQTPAFCARVSGTFFVAKPEYIEVTPTNCTNTFNIFLQLHSTIIRHTV